MVWIDYQPKKSLLVVVSGRPNLMLAQIHVFGPYSLDLLDLTLTIWPKCTRHLLTELLYNSVNWVLASGHL